MKAFDEIDFFISEKQFKKIEGKRDSYRLIGNEKYWVEGYFTDGDSLYMIVLRGLKKDASHYEGKVKNEWENLVSLISQKYGSGDGSDGYPPFFKMQNGYIQFSHNWSIGDKTINIGIGEDDSEYYSYCRIFRQSIYDVIEKKEATEKTNNIDASSSQF